MASSACGEVNQGSTYEKGTGTIPFIRYHFLELRVSVQSGEQVAPAFVCARPAPASLARYLVLRIQYCMR